MDKLTNQQPFALFDFDGTLIKGDSIIQYVRFSHQEKLLSLWGVLKILCYGLFYKLHIVSDEKSKTKTLSFIYKLPAEKRKLHDQKFAKSMYDSMYKEGLALLEYYKKKGYTVLLVSASTQNYMQYLENFLNVPVLSTPVDEQGTVHHNCKGIEKLIRIENYLKQNNVEMDKQKSVAYGDTKSDLPMLVYVHTGYITNGKPALQKCAEKKGLPLKQIQFKR